MTIGPDHSTLAGPLNQFAAILADAALLLLTIKLSVTEQTNATQTDPSLEDCVALMRLKDDGCPNGD